MSQQLHGHTPFAGGLEGERQHHGDAQLKALRDPLRPARRRASVAFLSSEFTSQDMTQHRCLAARVASLDEIPPPQLRLCGQLCFAFLRQHAPAFRVLRASG